ncbi:MAG: TetR/AcrR family transcriptional regulator C-terminal domain-containing protein [Eubacterium sp.]
MKNQDRSLQTKEKLVHALKECMQKKPLSKITVSEIINMCDVNRKTFYYHFEDIYSLLKWMFEQEAIDIVRHFDLLVDTEEAVEFVLDYIEQNQHIVNCAYDSMGRDEMKRFFYLDFIDIIKSLIEDCERRLSLKIDDDFRMFLADFYTEAFAGMCINYVRNMDNGTLSREKMLDYIIVIHKESMLQIIKAKGKPIKG